MSAATVTVAHPAPFGEAVRRWRIALLRAAGYERDAALVLAFDPEVDVRHASTLLERGCPHDLALQILF